MKPNYAIATVILATFLQASAKADIHVFAQPLGHTAELAKSAGFLRPHTATAGCQDVPYWSSTNCEYIMGGNATDSKNPITSATITISGKVKGWFGSASDEDTVIAQHTGSFMSWSQKFRFDSTHFIDGTKLRLTISLTDLNGATQNCWVEAVVFNRAYILNNHTFGFARDNGIIANILANANYHSLTAAYHRYSAIYNNMHKYTVFYIGTHGNMDGFGDCYDNGFGYMVDFVSPDPKDASVPNAVNLKTGSEPPYSFAWVNACLSAATSKPPVGGDSTPDLNRGTYFYGPDDTDRAYLGWDNWTSITLFSSWTHTVWSNLVDGETLGAAVVLANCSSADLGPCGPLDDDGSIDYNLIQQRPIKPQIIGDQLMKLHGVYKGPSDPGKFFMLL